MRWKEVERGVVYYIQVFGLWWIGAELGEGRKFDLLHHSPIRFNIHRGFPVPLFGSKKKKEKK